MTAPDREDDARPVAPYHDRETWLNAHATGVGGSEAAAVCGFDPHLSRREVWARKVHGEEPEEDPGSDLRRGRRQEALAVERFEKVTGRRTRRQPMRRHPEHEFMLADIDRQIVGEEEPSLLEVKVPRTPKFFEIRDHGLPEQYIVQLHHNMVVWGYDTGVFAVYSPMFDELVSFEVARDPELAAWIVDEERTFWTEHVLPEVPPEEPTPYDGELPEVPGEATERDDPEWEEAARRLRVAEANLSYWEEEHDRAEERLLRLADDGDEDQPLHVAGGGVRVRRSVQEGRISYKRTLEELCRAHDINPEPHLVEGTPYTRTSVDVTEPPPAEAVEEAAAEEPATPTGGAHAD